MDDDFALFLREIGQTQENMDLVMSSLPAPIPKDPFEKYFIGDSLIQGKGVFASEDVDGFIGRLWENDLWYEAGRFINHSPTPTCSPLLVEGVMILIGTARKGEELLVNYRDIREILLNEY